MNKLLSHTSLQRAAMVFSCFFFWACENDQKTIDDLLKPKVMIEEARNIETFMSQGGVLKAKLWAPYMLRSTGDTTYVEFTKTLHVNFFDSLGRLDSHLDALYGKYYENLNKVYLRDSVLVYNMQGDSLRSPDLWWDQNKQIFYTDKKVWIKRQGTIINGQNGMESKQDLSDIVVRQASGLVDVPDSLNPR